MGVRAGEAWVCGAEIRQSKVSSVRFLLSRGEKGQANLTICFRSHPSSDRMRGGVYRTEPARPYGPAGSWAEDPMSGR